jgi:Signal transduction histidine kinase
MRETAQSASSLGFEHAVRFVGPVDTAVSDGTGEQLLAALREVLTNAAKHAQASAVDVVVSVDGPDVVLTATDDGIGLPDIGLLRRSGMANIAARAQELGGECVAERLSAGGGTRVMWRAPAG